MAYQYRDASGRVDQYQETYLKKDGYLQSTTSGQNISNTPNVRPSTDASVYDTRGNLVAEAQHTQYAGGSLADTVHVFAYDGNGQIIERRDGTANGTSIDPGSNPGLETQHYVYVAGQQVAHYDDAGTLDVLAEVTAFSSNNGGPSGYVVQAGDTLESIAQAEYGDVSLWYVIAQANALDGDASLSIGQRLTIPTVTTHSNTATTFKPYDPSSIVGSTTPSLPTIAPPPPPPAGGGCSTAEILVIVVTVVVTIVTYGATSELLAGEGAALTTGEAVAAGAVAGAAGSVAGQLTGEAEGIQQGFDWGQVAEGAIGGAIGGGVTAGLASSGASSLTSTTSANGLSAWGDAVQGAATYAGNDLVAKATGESAHFSWAGLVASSLSSVVSGELGPTQTDQQIGNQASDAWDTAAATAAGGVVDKEVSQALGDNHVSSWDQIGENVVGNAIGAPIGHALSTPIDQAIASYQQRQAQAQLSATANEEIAATQAQLTASIWGNNSRPNDGQAALDGAWAGVEAGIGDEQEVQALSEGGYWPGSGADNYPGASAGMAMAYGASGSTHGEDSAAQMQQLRSLANALKESVSDPAVNTDSWNQAYAAVSQAIDDVANGAGGADQSIAQANMLVGAVAGSTATNPSLMVRPLEGRDSNGVLTINIYGGSVVQEGQGPAPMNLDTAQGEGGEETGGPGWGQVLANAADHVVTGVLEGSLNLVYQPIAQVHDLGLVTYGALDHVFTGQSYQPDYWSATGHEAVTDASPWAHVTQNLLGSNPVTGIAQAGWNLGTAISNGDANGAEEQLGGLVGGLILGKAGLEGEVAEPVAARVEPTLEPEVESGSSVHPTAREIAQQAVLGDNAGGEAIDRFNTAYDVYDHAGFEGERLIGHLQGIDFTQPVETTTLSPDNSYVQHVLNGNVGNYFAEPGTPAETLGINPAGRIPTLFAPTEEVTALRSTAAPITDTWTVPGETFEAQGGGTQLFVPDAGSMMEAPSTGSPLSQSAIDDILATPKGSRPDPSTYLSQDYIDSHLDQFSDGVTKFSSTAPTGIVGPPGGTFVMPTSLANELVGQSGGSVAQLEEFLVLILEH